MCGIFGQTHAKKTILNKSNTITGCKLTHRGPDNSRILPLPNITLGHQRLSIVELSTKSNQPFSIGPHYLVFNGEIYNYKKLRDELKHFGVIFTTEGDTELLLKGLILEGIDFVSKLNGIFAFAYYSAVTNELILARDPMGVKPLYYSRLDNNLLFASEEKELASFLNNPKPNLLYFLQYSDSGRCATLTPFKDIQICYPGTYVCYELLSDRLNEFQYYKPFNDYTDYQNKLENKTIIQDQIQSIKSSLIKSISLQIDCDVPYAFVCSGGLDSSLTTYIASELSTRPINLFFVDVKHEQHTELTYAQQLSNLLPNSNLHVINLDKYSFLSSLPSAIYYNDEPLAHPNSVGLYLLAQKMSMLGYKVAIAGEGCDELYGGYLDRHVLKHYFLKASKVFSLLPNKYKIALKNLLYDSEKSSILYNHERYSNSQFHSQLLDQISVSSMSDIDKFLTLDQYDYMQPILQRTDRMFMAFGIEARVPYLDYEFVRLSRSLPHTHKVSRFMGKRAIKHIALDYLPSSFVHRKKRGFSLPLDSWANIDSNFFRDGFITRNMPHLFYKTQLFPENASHKYKFRLLSIEIWGRIFMYNINPQKISEQLLTYCN